VARAFAPWKKDRARGVRLFLASLFTGLFAIWLATNQYFLPSVVFALCALILIGFSISSLKRARIREFGKSFEQEFIERALAELEKNGFKTRANVFVYGIGDVDLVVTGQRSFVVVEIKSFRRWSSFMIFTGAREQRALAQVERQRRALRAKHGLIWLPQGKPTFFQKLFGTASGNINVVFGDERDLAKTIRKILI